MYQYESIYKQMDVYLQEMWKVICLMSDEDKFSARNGLMYWLADMMVEVQCINSALEHGREDYYRV